MRALLNHFFLKALFWNLRLGTVLYFHRLDVAPFGYKPRATRKEYLRIAEKACQQEFPEIDNFSKSCGYELCQDWLDNLALHTQVVVKQSEICYAHGKVLYSALSKYISDRPAHPSPVPLTVVETGTARGFSAVCMAKALFDRNHPGAILTMDILPHDKKIFWNCIDDTEGKKTRGELLHHWADLVERYVKFIRGNSSIDLKRIAVPRIHFAFLDGDHHYKSVATEFEIVASKQLPGDVIVCDDYSKEQYPGLVRAVDEGCQKYSYAKHLLEASPERRYLLATKQ